MTNEPPLNRRVLLVTRELPPAIGPHPIRVAKLAKYLPEFGWTPTILSVPSDYSWSRDHELASELDGVEIVRVPRLFGRVASPTAGVSRTAESVAPIMSSRQRALRSFRSRLSRALLMPDPAVTWAIPAARRCAELAQGFDVVFTTAPPFSTHLIGERAARAVGVPWVAEYRDNWTVNPLYRRGPVAQRINARTERRFLRRATGVVVVSDAAAEEMVAAFPWLAGSVTVARNGYDPDDLPSPSGRPEVFEIAYAGSLDERRDPRPFLRALARVASARQGFLDQLHLRFMGNIAPWVLTDAEAAVGSTRVSGDGLVPHREALARAVNAAVLLGITTRQEAGGAGLTSKLFEYLGLRRPVLMLAPAGPARDLVARSGGGLGADPEDEEGIAAALTTLYDEWTQGRERIADTSVLEGLTRRETARAVANALSKAAETRG